MPLESCSKLGRAATASGKISTRGNPYLRALFVQIALTSPCAPRFATFN
jgi:transposase